MINVMKGKVGGWPHSNPHTLELYGEVASHMHIINYGTREGGKTVYAPQFYDSNLSTFIHNFHALRYDGVTCLLEAQILNEKEYSYANRHGRWGL